MNTSSEVIILHITAPTDVKKISQHHVANEKHEFT